MNHRRSSFHTLQFSLMGLISATPTLFGSPAESLPAKPNIIIIQSDDHGYADLSHTEIDTGAQTPNLDRLAAEGVRFTNGYATSPICTPSRIGLLTGQYQQKFGNWLYGGPGVPTGVETLPELLRQAGYRTGMVGKFHVNRPFEPGLRNFPLNHGFDEFFGFNAPATHYLKRGDALEEAFMEKLSTHAPNHGGYPVMFYEPLWQNTERVEPAGFTTDLFTEAALDFIESAESSPYFLLLSYSAIHDQTYQLPEAYFEEIGMEQPRDWDPSVETFEEWQEAVFGGGKERAYILGQIRYLDQGIGRLIDHLDATGQRDNTVVIYVSDNGGSVHNLSRNDPLRGGKFNLAEGGIRIPFLVSFPGVFASGQVIDNVVSTLDLLPTAAALAGQPIPEDSDGIDLLPLFDGRDPNLENETLVWDTGTKALTWAVRKGDWKLYFARGFGNRITEAEGIGFRLTNLKDDPSEAHNLIDAYPAKAAELGAVHRQWLETILAAQNPQRLFPE